MLLSKSESSAEEEPSLWFNICRR